MSKINFKEDLDRLLKKPSYRKPKEQVSHNLIGEILNERDMTQQELSDLTGIRPQHLSLIIKNGRKSIALTTALKISRALNLDVEKVFIYED